MYQPEITKDYGKIVMKQEQKTEALSKLIDALYKKLVVLVAIAGGFGAYAVKFITTSYWIGYPFAAIFILVSIAIFGAYLKLNITIKVLERIVNGK